MNVSYSKSFLCSTALVLALPGAALADVTSAEVWENWKNYASSMGQTVTTGSEVSDGGTLTLLDLRITLDFPEGLVVSNLASLVLREQSDGTVVITMSPDYPISISVDSDGEKVDLALMVRQNDTEIVASGGDGKIVYDYKAQEISVSLETLIVDGEEIDPTVTLSLKGFDGTYTSAEGDVNMLTSRMSAASLELEIDVQEPDGDGKFAATGRMSNLRSESNVVIPPDLDLEDPSAIFNGGFTVMGGFKADSSNLHMAMQDGDDSFDFSASATTSSLTVSLDKGTLNYGGTSTGLQYKLVSPQIPLPEIAFGMAEAAFNVLIPFGQSETPQDFAALIKLGGLEVSDTLWGMIDGDGALPHTPATLIIDLAGQMNWLIDITNEEALEAFDGEAPIELYGLTVNNLTLELAGAKITGDGDFTFDNSDLETFDGMPAPTGAINFDLTGINGLLDSLGQMGLLPQEQAMGARMMLGLFARPAGGEDHLTSTIEVKGDGSVFANGQQLK
ncbi:MAG: DUF2125 domain-containing protein [Paracoccaceae bacterium]